MKTTIVIIGLCVAIAGHASAQTNQMDAPVDTNAPVKESPVVMPDGLTTLGGAVYKNFRIERIDPGGLTVSYLMAGGGLGLTKITFDQLPPDLQRVYGYDSQAAADYQSGEKRATAQWAARMTADEQTAKVAKAEKEKLEEETAKETAKEATNETATATSKETAKETATETPKPADEEEKVKAAEVAAEAAKKAAVAAVIRATNPPAMNIMHPQPHED